MAYNQAEYFIWLYIFAVVLKYFLGYFVFFFAKISHGYI